MTYLQETFNTVRDHLLAQNEQCRGANSQGIVACRYWNKDTGLKCAVGVLIPERLYTPEIEGAEVDEVNLLCEMGWTGDQVNLLMDLQWIHDNREPKAWRRELTRAAAEWGLEA